MARLAESLRGLEGDVCVVFDGRPWDGAPQDGGGLQVRWAPVADDEIARLAAEDSDPATLCVVTSDGELAARVRAVGASVTGAGDFRRRLEGRA